ncbi:MAG: DUF1566 domain-containing protein [Oleiphilaceae bacterium]|nr:DUF1566 domain-containing protein [Oleiphilaceae bacterium]
MPSFYALHKQLILISLCAMTSMLGASRSSSSTSDLTDTTRLNLGGPVYLNDASVLLVNVTAQDLAIWRDLKNELGGFVDLQAYTTMPDDNAGVCAPGSLSQLAKDRSLDVMNAIRALHRLKPVERKAGNDVDADLFEQQVQQMAIMTGPTPSVHGATAASACFIQTGSDGGASSNIGQGGDNVDPAQQIIGWNHNWNHSSFNGNYDPGHRRHVLDEKEKYMTYGQGPQYTALKVFGFTGLSGQADSSNIDFVAMPYQGYPSFLLSGAKTVWSFRPVNATTVDYSSATVTLKDPNNVAQTLIDKVASDSYKTDNGTLRGDNVFVNSSAKQITWYFNYACDTIYTVNIDNVLVDGSSRYYQYQVNIIYDKAVGLTDASAVVDENVYLHDINDQRMWYDVTPINQKAWSGANSTCGGTTVNNLGDWHLPRINELRDFIYILNNLPSVDLKAGIQDEYWTNVENNTYVVRNPVSPCSQNGLCNWGASFSRPFMCIRDSLNDWFILSHVEL